MNDFIARNNAYHRHGDLLKEAANHNLVRSISTDSRPATARRPVVTLIDRLLHRRAIAGN